MFDMLLQRTAAGNNQSKKDNRKSDAKKEGADKKWESHLMNFESLSDHDGVCDDMDYSYITRCQLVHKNLKIEVKINISICMRSIILAFNIILVYWTFKSSDAIW